MIGMVKIRDLIKEEKQIIDILCSVMDDVLISLEGGKPLKFDYAKKVYGKNKIYHKTLANCAGILYAGCYLLRQSEVRCGVELESISLKAIVILEELIEYWNRVLQAYDLVKYSRVSRIDILKEDAIQQ